MVGILIMASKPFLRPVRHESALNSGKDASQPLVTAWRCLNRALDLACGGFIHGLEMAGRVVAVVAAMLAVSAVFRLINFLISLQ